ncbi:MAG: threonine/serine dehydratase [Alphaproteobacteria bacterium]
MTPTASISVEPTFGEIRKAAERVRRVAVETPVLHSPELDQRVGGRILIKPESLQRTGSFKIRGAYNFIGQLDRRTLDAGIVAYSSGNHAQGVAAAARAVGASATIVMPTDAPEIKLANTHALGAEVVTYDRGTAVREEIAAEIAATRGATIVPPYDHPRTIEGQGTVGFEFERQVRDAGHALDALLVSCGGGGLAAGIALAFAGTSPDTRIYAVEPEDLDDTARSLAAGRRVSNRKNASSICDALRAPTPGKLTFAINRRLLSGGVAVSDDEVRHAMAYAFRVLKLVVEPGGAAALAAALSGGFDCRDKTVGIVISGGNVDRAAFADAVQPDAPHPG